MYNTGVIYGGRYISIFVNEVIPAQPYEAGINAPTRIAIGGSGQLKLFPNGTISIILLTETHGFSAPNFNSCRNRNVRFHLGAIQSSSKFC
jgi:hypothetical protein